MFSSKQFGSPCHDEAPSISHRSSDPLASRLQLRCHKVGSHPCPLVQKQKWMSQKTFKDPSKKNNRLSPEVVPRYSKILPCSCLIRVDSSSVVWISSIFAVESFLLSQMSLDYHLSVNKCKSRASGVHGFTLSYLSSLCNSSSFQTHRQWWHTRIFRQNLSWRWSFLHRLSPQSQCTPTHPDRPSRLSPQYSRVLCFELDSWIYVVI